MAATNALLAVDRLRVVIGSADASEGVEVVSGVSFHLDAGEIVGLVGESGSGKSITAMSLLGLLPREARSSGSARLRGRELLSLTRRELQSVRGDEIGIIYQEPMTALDPVVSVGEQIAETIRAHRDVSRAAAKRQAIELLARVGIPDAPRRYSYFPHELSGGMRQRVVIAIALCCEPSLLVADEPTTALDVTIQAQILELLQKMGRENEMAVLLISHNLGVVGQICNRVMVMYAGEIVEEGPIEAVLFAPAHPYTSGLLAAMPVAHYAGALPTPIAGRLPQPGTIRDGCRFAPRCTYAQPRCSESSPPMIESSNEGTTRSVSCFRSSELMLPGVGQSRSSN